MKKLFSIFLSTAVVALTATGCSTDDTFDGNGPGTGQGRLVRIYADNPANDGTRASLEVGASWFTAQWEAGDELAVFASEKGLSATPAPVAKFTYNEATSAFEGSLTGGQNDWIYHGFYPFADNTQTHRAEVAFGNLRIQKGNAFNSSFDPLVAAVLECDNALPGETESGDAIKLNFKRLSSILNFKLTSATTDEVAHLLLTSENESQILSAQELVFNLTEGHTTQIASSGAGESNLVAMGFEAGTAPTANQITAFFNVLPGNYDGLTLEVFTKTGKVGKLETVVRNDVQKPFEAGKLYLKEVSGLVFEDLAAPSLNWPGQDIDAIHEIDDIGVNYTAAIDITAPGGIAGLEVEVISPVLNHEELGISVLDLFRDDEIPGLGLPYEGLGLDSGIKIQYKKSSVFDITELVPLIGMLAESLGGMEGSLHIFNIKVTDLAGQVTQQALTFRIAGNVTYESGDLWTNEATLSINNINPSVETVALNYRVKGKSTWNAATVTGSGDSYTASITPTWTTETNDAGLTIYRVDSSTGVFAQKTYEYQLLVDGVTVEEGEFTPSDNEGDIIPNGDMENSSIPCFTLNDSKTTTFWGSGNNSYAKELCARSTFNGMGGNYCAKLSATMAGVASIKLLAAGNLFTATFTKPLTTGTVAFGQQYNYTARPTAVRVKYHATIGMVDQNTHSGPLTKGVDQDVARIFVCIVDWDSRHETKSGVSAPSGVWDPATQSGLNDARKSGLIGYGSLFIDQTTPGDSMIEVELPIHYYDKTTKPSKNYQIIISAATSAYGDYMNGCSTNVMYVDDFEWVY